jgi:hypothetical protein
LDTDADGVPDVADNCPAVANPGQQDADADSKGDHCDTGDSDGDGYSDEVEARFIGTAADQRCGPAGWPSDLYEADPPEPVFPPNTLDIADVTSFLAPFRRLDTNREAYTDNARWDLIPGPGPFTEDVNIQDLSALFAGDAGSGAFPPMFGFERAYDRTCSPS